MNVHGINDGPPQSDRRLQNNRSRQQPRQEDNGAPWGDFNPAVSIQNLQYAEQKKILFVSGRNLMKNPRKQNFLDMLVFAMCPTMQIFSITLLIILAQTGMFVGEAIYGINKQGELLQISTQALLKFGANFGPLVVSGQVYRLLSAIFVHNNFVHFLLNVIATFILVSRIQYTYGPIKTLVAFLITGIAGNIFSLATRSDFSTSISAGSSTALLGMIGIILGYIIINWVGLSQAGDGLRCMLICQFLILAMFILLFTPFSNSIDHMGHLGGFLAGIWVSAIHQPIIQTKRENIIRLIFLFFLAAQLTTTFCVVFLTR